MLLQLNWMFRETIGKPMLELFSFSRPVAAKLKLNSLMSYVSLEWRKPVTWVRPSGLNYYIVFRVCLRKPEALKYAHCTACRNKLWIVQLWVCHFPKKNFYTFIFPIESNLQVILWHEERYQRYNILQLKLSVVIKAYVIHIMLHCYKLDPS